MKVETVVVGELECNCYIISKDKDCIIVDPGDDYDKIKEQLQDKNPLAVLITHHHDDHIGALDDVLKDYNIPVYDYNNIKDRLIEIGPFSFTVLATPGHTSDLVTYYFEEEKVMFVGDFIFYHNIGRCDLPSGDFETMLKSIAMIKKYPLDTKIYSGHGRYTTLEEEIKYNPYFS